MRRWLWLLMAMVLLPASCAQPDTPRITVREQTIVCGSDILVEDICLPQVSGFSEHSFEDMLNAQICAFVDNARKDAREQARVTQQWVDYVCVLRINYEVKNNGGLFSMRLTSDLDNGGLGMPQTVYINADTNKSQSLTLDDLFVSADYRARVDEHILLIIRKDKRFTPGDFKGVSEKSKFFVSGGRLFIAFDKYEIASGMSGEPEFEIPKELIKKYLKRQYAPYFQ